MNGVSDAVLLLRSFDSGSGSRDALHPLGAAPANFGPDFDGRVYLYGVRLRAPEHFGGLL